MRRRRILITGSSGRLGAPLTAFLSEHHEVVQFDLCEPPTAEQAALGRVFCGSFADPDLVERAMEGVDTVVHCGAIPGTCKPYHTLLETNVLGTFNVLEAAGNRREVEQFVHISSITYHGLTETPPEEHRPEYLPFDEDHPSSALDYYGCTKVQAEFWCEKYVQRFGKPCVIIRPPWIVTPEREPEFRAQPAPDVPRLNDYIGTTDLIDAIVRAMDYAPRDGLDRFLVHAPDQRSTMPSLELVERFFPGIPVDREKLSRCGGFGALVDCGHAEEKLGWQPRYRCQR